MTRRQRVNDCNANQKEFKVSIFAKHITSFPSPCNGRFKSKELFSNHLKTQIIDGNIILVNIAIIYYIVINFVIVNIRFMLYNLRNHTII